MVDVTTTSLTLGVISTILGVLAHIHMRSKCCGRTASIDISPTAPPPEGTPLAIKNPP